MGNITGVRRLWGARRPDRALRAWWQARSARERRGQHAPALWSVWAAAPLVVLAGCLLAFLVYERVHEVAVPVEVPGGSPRVDSLDVIRTTLSMLAFIGALLAGLYAYRKQRLTEGDAARADAQQFADRYTKSAEQLGSDQAAIRLAGVYAMARLGDDWLEQRQTCIDVLCAYLRMPYQPPDRPEHRPGEDQVRRTIVRVIAAHLRLSTTTPSWSTADLDLSGARLEDADFTGASFVGFARFAGASFTGIARFAGASFASVAGFEGVSFADDAGFMGASFASVARFEGASSTPTSTTAPTARSS